MISFQGNIATFLSVREGNIQPSNGKTLAVKYHAKGPSIIKDDCLSPPKKIVVKNIFIGLRELDVGWVGGL